MRLRDGCILGVALAMVPGSAGAAPTSVTVLEGRATTGPTRVLVAGQLTGGGTIAARAMRVDDRAGARDVQLRLVRGGCSTAARRKALLTFQLRDGAVTGKRRTLGRRVVRRPLSWYVPDMVGDPSGMCAAVARPARAGAVASLRDTATGEGTGLVALQRRGQRVRVSTLVARGDGALRLFGASTEACSAAMSAGALDWSTGLKADGNEVAMETLELTDVRPQDWRSLAVLPAEGGDLRRPISCCDWELSEIDA